MTKKQMNRRIKDAYRRGIIHTVMFILVNGFIAWYMYIIFEKLFS